MPLPVADLSAAVAGLDDPLGAKDDEAADAVDLRLNGEPIRVSDRGHDAAPPVVRELGDDVEHVMRIRLAG